MPGEPSRLQIFTWAAVHHEEFCYCLIQLPIALKLRRSWNCGAIVWAIETHWRKPSIFIPWKVQAAYYNATGSRDDYDYDEIPF